MKRIILFFAVCLGLSVSQTTFANDAEMARAASKRTSAQSVSATQSATRSVTAGAKRSDGTKTSAKNTRTATKPQQRVISSRTTQNQPSVKPRETTVKQAQTAKRVSTTSRAASARTVNSRPSESRTSATRSATIATKRISRAAELDNEKITNIKSLNFSKCKTVYYECMDEFCANKDANLRRCACSSRIHEFDNIKKQLSNAEDKMLDFNQRLLTVNLDKEDAAAINVATEGELAFQKKDTTESEKLLQKITSTLNNSGDSKINNNLSAISLSLDMDSAWDSIDSMSGVATASKNGVDLYNAARPVCIEMAKEVCSDEELDIAQNGYKLTIQQDCDTVAKSYKTQYNSAMEKIHESAALLDISRLNVHQQRNSDDTLTCKKKILTQLSDTSVCGENLYKCLDTSGQYIDPSTGSAFLSENLYELASLLKEPGTDEKWSSVDQNESFVNYLNSKKEFLKPAMEQCRDISDTVWKEFLDDALAQIKLAQNAKLEEIRRSCTTLVTECKTKALEDLSDFDARALSTFSISADKTANKMCSQITESCSVLMEKSGLSTDWASGMSGIAMDTTEQKIKEACTNVGRDCIVQQCSGTSGNFALCQDETSDIRVRLLTMPNTCYEQIEKCIADADGMTSDKQAKILKSIWGGCENTTIQTGDTLLSWFATNTGSTSCNASGCKEGYTMKNGVCEKIIAETTTDGATATNPKQIINITKDGSITNYCATGVLDIYGNCCTAGTKDATTGICVPNGWQAVRLYNMSCSAKNGTNAIVDNYLCPVSGNLTLYCVTDSNSTTPVTYYSQYAEYACGTPGSNGMWLVVDENGNYFKADKDNKDTAPRPLMYYRANSSSPICEYKYTTDWGWSGTCEDEVDTHPTDNEFLIRFVL